MAQVLIRNLDDDVVADLKRQAAEANTSLEQFLRELLTEKSDAGARQSRLLDGLRELRARMTPAEADPAALVREDREAGYGAGWIDDLAGR